jgi:hypothetical protein
LITVQYNTAQSERTKTTLSTVTEAKRPAATTTPSRRQTNAATKRARGQHAASIQMPRPSILSLVFWSTSITVWTPLQFSLLYDFDPLPASSAFSAFFETTIGATTANPGDGDDTTAASYRTFDRSKSKSTNVGDGADSGNKNESNDPVVTDYRSDDQHVGYFSACLMVMDDNHYLIEWLAYHYQVLPLRRLIVAVDPSSRTSPQSILKRYSRRNLMNITIWTNVSYYHPMEIQQSIRHQTHTQRKTSTTQEDMFRSRQRHFIQQCLQTLHEEYKEATTATTTAGTKSTSSGSSSSAVLRTNTISWVAMVDPDEYIVPQISHQRSYTINNSPTKITATNTTSTTTTTVWQALERERQNKSNDPYKDNDKDSHSACLALHRTQFTNYEEQENNTNDSIDNPLSVDVPEGLRGEAFLTLRYPWRRIDDGPTTTMPGKALIDISQLGIHDINPTNGKPYFRRGNHNPHRPLMDLCPAKTCKLPRPLPASETTKDVPPPTTTATSTTTFVVHHYQGSVEQFTHRNDVRSDKRTMEQIMMLVPNTTTTPIVTSTTTKTAALPTSTPLGLMGLTKDKSAQFWLSDFVQSVGTPLAHKLLNGAGQIKSSVSNVIDSYESLGARRDSHRF